jgi:hypothetical protein
MKIASFTCYCVTVGVSLAAASLCSAQSVLSTQCPGGLPLTHAAGPSLSIGGAGTGVRNDFFGMADNVANLGGMKRAIFSASASFDFTSINEGGASSSLFALSPRLISFAFHINPVGTFGFSLDQRTTTLLKFVKDTVLTLYTGSSVTDSIGFYDRGGLKSWQAGWGREIGGWGYAGLSYERMYMSSDNITLYSADLGGGEPRYDSVRFLFRGNAVRGGILVPMKKLTLGLSGEYVFAGDAERTTTSTAPSSAARETFSVSLPPSLSLGASYDLSPSWMAAASTGITLWKRYRSADTTFDGKVGNALSFSAGVQYIPSPNLLVPKYWEIMQYRLGFHYSELPVVTGSEFSFTAGVGLPLLAGGGLVDFIAEYGSRSDSRIKFENFSERFLHLYIGINGGRKWSQKSRIRY